MKVSELYTIYSFIDWLKYLKYIKNQNAQIIISKLYDGTVIMKVKYLKI